MTSKKETSQARAERRLRALISSGSLTPTEQERRAQGVQRLKERLSKIPYYAECAEKDGPGYWEKFYASRIMS